MIATLFVISFALTGQVVASTHSSCLASHLCLMLFPLFICYRVLSLSPPLSVRVFVPLCLSGNEKVLTFCPRDLCWDLRSYWLSKGSGKRIQSLALLLLLYILIEINVIFFFLLSRIAYSPFSVLVYVTALEGHYTFELQCACGWVLFVIVILRETTTNVFILGFELFWKKFYYHQDYHYYYY